MHEQLKNLIKDFPTWFKVFCFLSRVNYRKHFLCVLDYVEEMEFVFIGEKSMKHIS